MLFISCVIPETASTMLFGEKRTMPIQGGIQHCILNEWKHFESYIFAASEVECKPSKDHGPTYTFNQLIIHSDSFLYDFHNILSSAKHHSKSSRFEYTVAVK